MYTFYLKQQTIIISIIVNLQTAITTFTETFVDMLVSPRKTFRVELSNEPQVWTNKINFQWDISAH